MSESIINFVDRGGDGMLTDRLQRPLHDLRISVMDRCNFRCPYCMPEDKFHKEFKFMRSSERLSFDEIVRVAQVFRRLGVRKLRITGGEPLLRQNLPDLIGDLSRIDGIEDLALCRAQRRDRARALVRPQLLDEGEREGAVVERRETAIEGGRRIVRRVTPRRPQGW